jgi:hypothetical protein
VFLRDGDDVYRTYNTTSRGVDRLLFVRNILDLTPYGRQEDWEDSPPGYSPARAGQAVTTGSAHRSGEEIRGGRDSAGVEPLAGRYRLKGSGIADGSLSRSSDRLPTVCSADTARVLGKEGQEPCGRA